MTSLPVTVYDALHWESGRGMWRYSRQLIRHIEACEFLPCQHGVLKKYHSQHPLLQVIGAELLEPSWRIFKFPHIAIFPYNVLPFICTKRAGVRVLIVHDLMFLESRFGLSIGALFRRVKFGGSVKKADKIICVSETTKRDLLCRWPNIRVTVIPNALDILFFEPFGRQRPRNKIFRVLHFGGAIKSKGTGLLLKAIARLISDGCSVEVFIASMSENEGFIQRQASACGLGPKDHTILPRLSDAELVNLYRVCDLHCMPSLGEGFGLPVIEAASQGLPNLLSPLPVFRELIADAALYFEEWTAEAIAIGIKTAMKTDLKLMVAKAREHALSYSFANVHEHYAKPFLTGLIEDWRQVSSVSNATNATTEKSSAKILP